MAYPTLAPTWTPTSCPADTDIWEIYFTTSAVFFLLGPLTATSDCAPSSYTPTITYYAASCPSGYTSACTQGLDDSTTVCCPTALSLTCATSPKVYESLTLSCGLGFTSSYTLEVTTTSVFGGSNSPGMATVTFTPYFDAVNGFGIEYIKMRTTSSSSSYPTATATATTNSLSSSTTSSPSESNSGGNSLSNGGIGGIVVAVVAFIVIVVLVWNRTKITAWIHQKTAPRLGQAEQKVQPNTLQPSPGQYPYDFTPTHTVTAQPPVELDTSWRVAELPVSQRVVEADTS